jgi:hypothetical protein
MPTERNFKGSEKAYPVPHMSTMLAICRINIFSNSHFITVCDTTQRNNLIFYGVPMEPRENPDTLRYQQCFGSGSKLDPDSIRSADPGRPKLSRKKKKIRI